MLDKNQVLLFVKERGPVIPKDVSRQFGEDTFFTGAVLSQLVDNKEIKISHAKIGGSPVYYYAGQEEKLDLLYQHLPGKEKEAYDLLKEKKIIRDTLAEPAIRVAFRNIKDFAKALEVNISGNKEIFWKWYLFPNNEAEAIIRQTIVPKAPEKPEPVRSEAEKPEQKIEMQKQPETLMLKLKKVFAAKEIEILETKILRKESDIEMTIKIPSPVGKLKYFCKVRDKKRSNDKDLSAVFVQSQMRRLPVLYVTTGQLTKKAEEMLEKEFKIISVLFL